MRLKSSHAWLLALAAVIPILSVQYLRVQSAENHLNAAQWAARCVKAPRWAVEELATKFPHHGEAAVQVAGFAGSGRKGIKVSVNEAGTPDCQTDYAPDYGQVIFAADRQPMAAYLTKPGSNGIVHMFAIMELAPDPELSGKRIFVIFTGHFGPPGTKPQRKIQT
ncbi:MAG TPA: hypothetical protein VEA36_00830 [Candidatus Paceibacterota bacterium]|nr:hypothetical protein [Candidatus Paceibacterota bacterium]